MAEDCTSPNPASPRPGRFQGAASHYLQGRPPYAAELYRRVAAWVGLDHRHRVLDLGCGPGQLATGFACFAAAVLAMDPEPEMLAIGRSRAEGSLTNVTFLAGGSTDLAPEIGGRYGPFHLVTIGRAFHWMDLADTLRRLDTMVAPDGAVAIVRTLHPDVPDNAWLEAFDVIRQRHSGVDRADWRRPQWPKDETLLLASPFGRLDRMGLIERRRTPAARLIDRALSMSSSSRDRLGAGAVRLAQDVAALADAVATDGLVDEVVETTVLIASRRR